MLCRAEGITAQWISSQKTPDQKLSGVLSGIAARHDGKSASLTAPNARAQKIMLEDAVAMSGVGMESVSCIQAHGTGTALGDPTEVSGLSMAFGGKTGNRPLTVTSHKANVGHSEAPSGMLGLCKAQAALSQRLFTPNAHLRDLNPILSQSMMML